MKSSTIISGIAMILSLTLLPSADAETCDRLAKYNSFDISWDVKSDLVRSVWNISDGDEPATLTFEIDNTEQVVHVLRENQPEIAIGSWSVVKAQEGTRLHIEEDSQELDYLLKPVCDGYELTDDDGETAYLELISDKSALRAEELHRQLVGNWKVVNEIDEGIVDLEWHFNQDGTFNIITGPDRFHSTLGGEWNLTDDQMHVELAFSHSIEPDNIYARDVLRIHSMDYEDLVISGDTVERLVGKADLDGVIQCEKDMRP